MFANKKAIIIVAVIIFIIIIISFSLSLINSNDFKVISTTPTNGSQNIPTGEMSITFTTDKPVKSIDDYTITIDPPLEFGSKLLTDFPTQTVTNLVLGGLSKNTTYTVTVANRHTNDITSWSFTTSNEQPESSTAAFNEEQEQLKEDYYPLFDTLPYETDAIKMDYSDRLTLQVKIKKINQDKDVIKKEVEDWIREKGVDPSTHTINYENAF